jgi:hypothetical protein
MLMLSVTTMLTAGLVLIKFFDSPYSDVAGSIKPEAMERTLRTLSELHSERRTRAPCDAGGRPIRPTA